MTESKHDLRTRPADCLSSLIVRAPQSTSTQRGTAQVVFDLVSVKYTVGCGWGKELVDAPPHSLVVRGNGHRQDDPVDQI